MRHILSQSKCYYSLIFTELRELCAVLPRSPAETDVSKFLLDATWLNTEESKGK